MLAAAATVQHLIEVDAHVSDAADDGNGDDALGPPHSTATSACTSSSPLSQASIAVTEPEHQGVEEGPRAAKRIRSYDDGGGGGTSGGSNSCGGAVSSVGGDARGACRCVVTYVGKISGLSGQVSGSRSSPTSTWW